METFTIVEPESDESPVVVEVPHAGLHVPPPFAGALVAPVRAISRDADLYVDRLYADATQAGATLLTARCSRLVCDLNRAEEDWDESVVDAKPSKRRPPVVRGVVWRLTGDGDPVHARRLSTAELEHRLDELHRPYHRTLLTLLERKRAKFGVAVLLAAHSMPSRSRTPSGALGAARADVVPGTQGRSTAAGALIDVVERLASASGMSVRHDDPYRGGFSTRHYGRPAEGMHAVQVELARRLYMDEATLTPHTGFDTTRAWCTNLVATLGRHALEGASSTRAVAEEE